MKVKINTLLFGLAIGLVACGPKADNQSSDVNEDSTATLEMKDSKISEDAMAENQGNANGHFGEKIDEQGAISMDEFDQMIANSDDTLEVKIMSKAMEVCKKKGCWMKINLADGNLMRVTFKDYGFFVPEDIVNKKVVLKGKAFKDTTSVEDLKHYAEDGGKSAEEIASITEPEIKTTFIAEGVIMK